MYFEAPSSGLTDMALTLFHSTSLPGMKGDSFLGTPKHNALHLHTPIDMSLHHCSPHRLHLSPVSLSLLSAFIISPGSLGTAASMVACSALCTHSW